MKEPTLFIIGAGGSWDLKFPLGEGLRTQISAALTIKRDGWLLSGGDERVVRHIESFNQDRQRFENLLNAADHVARNVYLTDSIDEFLSSNPDPCTVEIAKIAIASIIANCENTCLLQLNGGPSENFRFDNVPIWMSKLFARLHRALGKDEGPEAVFQNTRFITFNYDRVLEQYLSIALSSFYKIPYSAATEIVSAQNIVHVYGSLGPLSHMPEQSAIPFGVPFGSISQAAERIRTFSESVADNEIEIIRDMIFASARLVFLGFSFATINMDLIGRAAPKVYQRQRRVYGTCLDMSDHNVQFAKSRLDYMFNNGSSTSTLLNVDCKKFFEDLSLIL